MIRLLNASEYKYEQCCSLQVLYSLTIPISLSQRKPSSKDIKLTFWMKKNPWLYCIIGNKQTSEYDFVSSIIMKRKLLYVNNLYKRNMSKKKST